MFRTIFITDGSEAAFYAAVFRAWKCPSAHIDSAKNFQPLITDEIKPVSQTEEETEEQAWQKYSLWTMNPRYAN